MFSAKNEYLGSGKLIIISRIIVKLPIPGTDLTQIIINIYYNNFHCTERVVVIEYNTPSFPVRPMPSQPYILDI